MKVDILGVQIDQIGFDEAVGRIESFLHDGRKHLVVTPYAESVVAARTDEEFRKVISEADLAAPDGGGLLAAAEFLSFKLPTFRPLRIVLGLVLGGWVGLKLLIAPRSFGVLKERVSGTDLFEALCHLSARKGYRVFLLGGGGDSAARAAEKLSITSSQGGSASGGNYQLSIRSHQGPRELSKASAAEITDIINNINAFAPDFLFVAFKPGEQEKWLYQNMKSLNAKVFMAVGGAFDMVAGLRPRAPVILRRLNLEWLWRLFLEPSRIKRIYRAAVVFPWLVLRAKIR